VAGIGASGLGGAQHGIYKPDYGPFGMGPTNGPMFNHGAQPLGSRFESVPQQALESSRNAINDLAALPSAMSGMMGLNGVGMMGNALQGIGRGLQQDPIVAMGMS
tara:strand:- start:79 stop:393 length:315 start_codon:yes stop_codon:yes gene_type:complete